MVSSKVVILLVLKKCNFSFIQVLLNASKKIYLLKVDATVKKNIVPTIGANIKTVQTKFR